jgi:hypothetical protein
MNNNNNNNIIIRTNKTSILFTALVIGSLTNALISISSVSNVYAKSKEEGCGGGLTVKLKLNFLSKSKPKLYK